MSFKYIWGLLESKEGRAPSNKMFSTSKSGYKFYPFVHEGRVFTFDKLIWNDKFTDNKAVKDTQNVIWPNPKQVEEMILGVDQNSPFCMFAFSNAKLAPTIERGKTVRNS